MDITRAGAVFFAGWGRRAAALTLVVVLVAMACGLFETPRLALFDLYEQTLPAGVSSHGAVIVAIDDASIERVGQFPWPRQITADLVRKILAAKPSALALDAVYPEPDRTSPAEWMKLAGPLSPALRQALLTLPNHDRILAGAIASGPVALGVVGLTADHPAADKGPLPPLVISGAPPNRSASVPYSNATLRSIPLIDSAARGHGVNSADPDADGTYRRLPLVSSLTGRLAPALSLEVLRLAAHAPRIDVVVSGHAIAAVGFGTTRIPTEADGSLWIHYREHDDSRFVSAADVLAGTVPAARFRGRPVFISIAATGLSDQLPTPVGMLLGTEIEAEVADSIVDGRFAARPAWALPMEYVLTIVLALVLIGAAPSLRPRGQALVTLAVVAALAGLGFVLWWRNLWLIDVATPAISETLVFVALTAASYAQSERQRAYIRRAFDRYLSPDLVARIADDPSRLDLGGEERDMTVLFCDIRGYTRVSERLAPKEIIAFLTRFLEPASDILLAHRATIDKFAGDSIMAFWNAPLDDPDHARNAALGALALRDKIAELNAAPSAEWPGGVQIGIGLDSGLCCVGNVGSKQRLSYSLIGDTVNLASRIEGLTKVYEIVIAIGEGAAKRLADFALVEVDRVQVVGRAAPETISALIGPPELARDPAFRTFASLADEFRARYRARDWDGAETVLARLVDPGRRFGMERMLATFANRITAFRTSPPPADWDGVHIAEYK